MNIQHRDQRGQPSKPFHIAATLVILLLPLITQANRNWHASSGSQQNTLIELYTSEGCRSCPPADRWLSGLKHHRPSESKLIPLAFHVSYWDYIGWQDRFAKKRYDYRQEHYAHNNRLRTLYTPQFVLSGKDLRRPLMALKYAKKQAQQTAPLQLQLSARLRTTGQTASTLDIQLQAQWHQAQDSGKRPTALNSYIAIYENALESQINDGENDGKTLHHDYVVRRLLGPIKNQEILKQQRPDGYQQALSIPEDWNLDHLGLVAFSEDQQGRVLQAVQLQLAR